MASRVIAAASATCFAAARPDSFSSAARDGVLGEVEEGGDGDGAGGMAPEACLLVSWLSRAMV